MTFSLHFLQHGVQGVNLLLGQGLLFRQGTDHEAEAALVDTVQEILRLLEDGLLPAHQGAEGFEAGFRVAGHGALPLQPAQEGEGGAAAPAQFFRQMVGGLAAGGRAMGPQELHDVPLRGVQVNAFWVHGDRSFLFTSVNRS